DVVRGRAAQENGRALEILELAVPADGGLASEHLDARLVRVDGRGERRREEAWRDRVAVHAVPGPGLGHVARELHDAGLRRTVRGAVRQRPIALQRGDVEDAAPAPRLHRADQVTREEER